MAKSYKKRMSKFIKSTSKNVSKSLPVVNNGLKTASYLAKGLAKKTVPVVEEGVSAVYDTMHTGFNLGVKGAKNVGKGIKSLKKTISGGKRRRTKRNRRKRY